jgi:hypothetical protein
MNRTTLAAALLAAASVTACQPTTGPNSNLPSANANVAATPTPAPTVSANELIEKEKQLADAIRQKNWDAFSASVTDDMVYVTSNGAHDKAATLAGLRKLDMTEYTLTDFKVVNVDRDAAVVTYSSTAKGTYDGRPLPPGTMRESSAWVYRGGKWLNTYHQDTLVQPAPPPPASTPAPAASPAAASPAATPTPLPATATMTDRENHIWELLRQRQWDAFGALLADDMIEVEPDGVTNKAGTIDGVKRVNFTGTALSDFKEIKFDADAGLVTYVVKGSRDFGPQGARHTTVWVNRGGRWLAVFHQGTVIEP